MPLTIFFPDAGTYTVEDDGIRGNAISVIRNASGAIVLTFAHPSDSVTFATLTSGVHLAFNTADSFGTANVTVGDLTSAAASPDSIVVRALRTDGSATLVSNGSITEGGNDAAADLTAAIMVLSAISGVGTAANALETQTTFLEAETNTGGINLANFGEVQIGGITAEVAGLNVATSGDLNFSNNGFVYLSDTSGAATIHGGDLSGNVTLSAIGAAADIYAPIDMPAIHAAGGGITLNAGRDVLFGIGGASYHNDVLATGDIRITAGGNFQLDGQSHLRTGAFGGVVGGDIVITAGHDINLTNTTGGVQTIEAFAGDVILTTGPGGTYFQAALSPAAIETTDNIFLNADNVILLGGGLNTTGIGQIAVRPVTPGRAIDLGSMVDPGAFLGLSDAEFDRLYTLNVAIGAADAGPVEFSAALTPFIIHAMEVRSGTDIFMNSSLALTGSLTLRAGDDLHLSAAASFTGTDFIGSVDDAQDDGGLGGIGSLLGTLSVSTSVQLTGNADADTLLGSSANDILNGGAGTDTMAGGLGNDQYYVDSSTDVVSEVAGQGNDRIYAGSNYVLAAGVSVETLSTDNATATTAITLVGNEIANNLYGNYGNNNLFGSNGDDVIIAHDGDDTLNGGAGSDTMAGGLGDDSFYVDSSTDVVGEAAGQGTDRIYASANYVLAAGVSVETLSTVSAPATTAINLTGNELANNVYGNFGNNSLYGGGGNDTLIAHDGNDILIGGTGTDTMAGGLGNDSFYVDSSTDVINETAGQGTDRIYASSNYVLAAGASVETLSTDNNAGTVAITLVGNEIANNLYGNAGNNNLFGSNGNDVILALDGNDMLNGGAGADSLSGGAGADTFVFANAAGAGNIDTIGDYNVADDVIHIDNAVFTGLAAGALAAGAFNTGAAATDADDRIIYNSATGALLFDADGSGAGAAIQFATLAGGLALTASEFLVI